MEKGIKVIALNKKLVSRKKRILKVQHFLKTQLEKESKSQALNQRECIDDK